MYVKPDLDAGAHAPASGGVNEPFSAQVPGVTDSRMRPSPPLPPPPPVAYLLPAPPAPPTADSVPPATVMLGADR